HPREARSRIAPQHTRLGESVCDHRPGPGPAVCDPAPHRPWLWFPHAHVDERTRRATAMIMSPGLRKFALTVHVTSSIGWFGAVAAFLTLAVAGLTSQDVKYVRAAYLAMELTTWFVIIPLAL